MNQTAGVSQKKRLEAVFCLLVSLYSLSTLVGAANYYVDVKSSNCSDSGPGSEAQPFCTVQKAAKVTNSGDTVWVKPGIYRGGVREETPGTTWKGLGTSPDDVKILLSLSSKEEGWIITKTSGYSNVYQFNPRGQPVSSISELNQPTDLNRREPSEFTKSSDLNGVDGYFAWHTRDYETILAKDYFGELFCAAPNYCGPQTLGQAIKIVDSVEGSWIQDDDHWTNTRTIYFHPRRNRDGTTLDMEVGGFFDGPGCEFIQANSTLSNFSCYGTHGGNDGRSRFRTPTKGGNSLRIGGSGTTGSSIRAYAGRVLIFDRFGLSNFHLTGFLFTTGMGGIGARSGEYPGIVIENGEVLGNVSGFSWEGPWGTVDSPAIFRRLALHDTETWRFRDLGYRLEDGSYTDRGTPGQHRHTHGPAFGGCGVEISKNFIFENNTVWAVSDGVRIFGAQRGVVIRNNVIQGSLRVWSSCNPSLPGSIKIHNNVVGKGEQALIYGLTSPSEMAEVASSGSNLWASSDQTPFLRGDDVDRTLLQIQALGLEKGSLRDDLSNLSKYFNNPLAVLLGTGGDDFRLRAGSALIDAGDSANCGHATIVSKCDIGAYEFGAPFPTGPDPIHSEHIFTNGTSPVTPARPSAPKNLRVVQ